MPEVSLLLLLWSSIELQIVKTSSYFLQRFDDNEIKMKLRLDGRIVGNVRWVQEKSYGWCFSALFNTTNATAAVTWTQKEVLKKPQRMEAFQSVLEMIPLNGRQKPINHVTQNFLNRGFNFPVNNTHNSISKESDVPVAKLLYAKVTHREASNRVDVSLWHW